MLPCSPRARVASPASAVTLPSAPLVMLCGAAGHSGKKQRGRGQRGAAEAAAAVGPNAPTARCACARPRARLRPPAPPPHRDNRVAPVHEGDLLALGDGRRVGLVQQHAVELDQRLVADRRVLGWSGGWVGREARRREERAQARACGAAARRGRGVRTGLIMAPLRLLRHVTPPASPRRPRPPHLLVARHLAALGLRGAALQREHDGPLLVDGGVAAADGVNDLLVDRPDLGGGRSNVVSARSKQGRTGASRAREPHAAPAACPHPQLPTAAPLPLPPEAAPCPTPARSRSWTRPG
jgi:hypothetical protein